MIKFEQVFLQYVKEFFTLYDFSCEINSNAIFIGDFFNGTNAIIRILAKIDKNYKGEVFIDNINLKNFDDKDLNLAYLPKQPVMLKNKNIFKNLYFPLKIRKINKNIAKNLIFSIFLELKNNNINIFNSYLNNEINEARSKNDDDLINYILKIKVNKLSLSEQKILALIRSILRKPKYVLLENFFEDLNETHAYIAQFLINKLKENSTIIACEKDKNKLEQFKDFEIINLNEDKEKKEA